MTTSKEDVLRLAIEAGFKPATNMPDIIILPINEMPGNRAITKLIELVRKEAIAEEREAIAKICLDKRQLNSPEAINWNIALVSVVEAIRGRE